jgi:hypothetical protein
MITHFLAALGPYTGYIVGGTGLAAVLLLNQLIFRQRWKSYPTLAQYLAAHPECNRPRALSAAIAGRWSQNRRQRKRQHLPLHLARNRTLPDRP